jgi:putative phosphoserine phosphatase/1-acylglycerol-3-phosphate O-acyltransferase
MPNLLNLTSPPTVTIRVGEPVELRYRSAAADTRRIMAAISELLPPEAREKREPTDDELRATYPDGRLPDEG